MKWILVILLMGFLIGCNTSKRVMQTNVVLDGSASYITGGNGKDYFTKWEWKQVRGSNSLILNPNVAATQTNVIGTGVFAWQLKVTTHTGQEDSAIYSITVNPNAGK